MNKEKMVYIIMVNYNSSDDLIECLNSIVKLDYNKYKIVICDNNSVDSCDDILAKWCCDNQKKYVLFRDDEITRTTIISPECFDVVLINNSVNSGFAGGNNLAIKFSISMSPNALFWLLNVDTVVEPKSLKKLVTAFNDPSVGMAGSCLKNYYNRNEILAYGGRYVFSLGKGSHVNQIDKLESINYLVGASLMVSADFIKTIGYMNEEYFLYHEEIDWACRCKNTYKIKPVVDSIVYHKEGGITKKNDNQDTPDLDGATFSEKCMLKGNIIFAIKFTPQFTPMITVYQIIRIMYIFFIRKEYKRAKELCCCIFNAYKYCFLNKK